MYKKLIIAALMLAPYIALPAMAQDYTSDPAPASPGVTERVTERTNTTTNTTTVIPAPADTDRTNIINVPGQSTPVSDTTNWPLVGIIAAIVIVFFGILIAAMSGGTTTTRRTTVVKS